MNKINENIVNFFKFSAKMIHIFHNIIIEIFNVCVIFRAEVFLQLLVDITGLLSYFLDGNNHCYDIKNCIQEANNLKCSRKIKLLITYSHCVDIVTAEPALRY